MIFLLYNCISSINNINLINDVKLSTPIVKSDFFPEMWQSAVDLKLLKNPGVRFVLPVTPCRSIDFFASGVNFSRNSAIYNINESTMYILP